MLLTDGLAVKRRIFQQGGHLPRQLITTIGDRRELVFEIGIGAVTGRIALQRPRRDNQACQAKLPHTSIDLLVHLGQLSQGVAVRTQRLRYRPVVQILEEHTAIMRIVVLQAK